MPVTKQCERCGKTFSRMPSRGGRFCSVGCASRSIITSVNREKIVDYVAGGVTLQCRICNKNFEVSRSKAKRAKYCSVACRAKAQSVALRGSANPFWHGGERKIVCEECGKDFFVRQSDKDARFCSRSCRARFWTTGERNRFWQGGGVEVACKKCGKSYQVHKCNVLTTKFCSRECARDQVELICANCGAVFSDKRSASASRRTCSKACSAQWTAIHRRGSASNGWKGGKVTLQCLHCGCSFEADPTEATGRVYCSQKCFFAVRAITQRGSAHPNWRGGATGLRRRIHASAKYQAWRKAVLERDGRACQRCKRTDRRLHVHHVKFVATHPELIFEVDNGLTLCVPCHKELHKEVGHVKGEGRLAEYVKQTGII